MAYITRSDVETFLNITLGANGQTLVDALIPSIEAYVDDYTNRTWTKGAGEDITETYDGGVERYFIKQPPIASVESLTIDDDAQSEADEDFYVYEDHVLIPGKAASGYRNVVITYRTSSNEIPADLKHAIVRWVSDIFKSQDSAGKTISKITTGPMTIEYLAQDGIPAYVEKVLNRYRLVNI